MKGEVAGPLPDKEFVAQTSEQAAAKLVDAVDGGDAQIIPFPADRVNPVEASDTRSQYAVEQFTRSLDAAQTRYDSMQRMFEEAQANKDTKPEALKVLETTAANAYENVLLWQNRLEAAKGSSVANPSVSSGETERSTA